MEQPNRRRLHHESVKKTEIKDQNSKSWKEIKSEFDAKIQKMIENINSNKENQ